MASSENRIFFVRTATAQDIAAIQALLRTCWHATYDGIYGAERVASITAEWHSTAALNAQLKRLNSEFLVADDGEQIGGVTFAAASEDGATVVVHQLYVHPAHQRAGIGSSLLQEVEDSFPQARVLRLEVEEANGGAVAFYRHNGFELTGRVTHVGATVSGVAAAVYEKMLG